MKLLLNLIGAAVLAYIVLLGLLAWQQRRLLYVPDTDPPHLPSAQLIPGIRAITVRTADGLDLLAWFVPPAGGNQPVVLYLHGNAGHIGYRADRMEAMAWRGWGVLMLEYRGYGGNPGSPTETGLIRDTDAAYRYLRNAGFAGNRIVVWGESLGTGLVVRLASEQEVGAVVLEAPYTSIAAVARYHYPFVPVDLLLRDRFELLGRIGAVRAPILVMCGARDTIVPPAMSKRVFTAATSPKRLWVAPDTGHNDLGAAGAMNEVAGFLRDEFR